MTSPSNARSLVLVAALVVVAIVSVFEAISAVNGAMDPYGRPCGIDVFGRQLSQTASDCYVPIGSSLAFAVGLVVAGIAVALRPTAFAPPVALLSALLALTYVRSALQDGENLSSATLTLSLLAAIPFLVFAPTGPTAMRSARGSWILVLVGVGLLAALDMLFSGFMRTADPLPPQLGFVVVALAVLGAGLLSGKLRAAAADPGAGASD